MHGAANRWSYQLNSHVDNVAQVDVIAYIESISIIIEMSCRDKDELP